MRFTPTRTPSTPTLGSYVNLSNAIPYSAPGGRASMSNNGNGITLSTSSNSNYNMPNLANGQIITGTHISSPAISSPTQLEPRFIISKQKLEARNIGGGSSSFTNKSSTSLSNFFSKSRRGTTASQYQYDGYAIGSNYQPSSPVTNTIADNGMASHSPSSQSSMESSSSTTRHSSMADLRRFFRRSVSISNNGNGNGSTTPSSSVPRVSKLSAGLSAQRQQSTSAMSMSTINSTNSTSTNNLSGSINANGNNWNFSGNGNGNGNGNNIGNIGIPAPPAAATINSYSASGNSSFPNTTFTITEFPSYTSNSNSALGQIDEFSTSPLNNPHSSHLNGGSMHSHHNSINSKRMVSTSLHTGSGSMANSPKLSSSATSLNSSTSYVPISVGGNTTPQIPFSKRYHKFGDNLGAGAGGLVKLVKRVADSKVFAVKEFRSKYQHESKRDYTKKITSEYCIGSTLKHPNIVETIEISYENERIVQVMEYCDYDLFAIVMSNKMSDDEINCCFKQILNGLRYIHSIGLSHRDLKLDNCVVTKDGIVKLIDFGSSVVFQYPFSNTLIEAQGIVGSDPYLAPEVCVFNKYDPRPVDIWSAAIMYCCMTLKKFPWKVPKLSDPSFKMFASREPGVTFGDLLRRLPDPPSYTDLAGVNAEDALVIEAQSPDLHNHHLPSTTTTTATTTTTSSDSNSNSNTTTNSSSTSNSNSNGATADQSYDPSKHTSNLMGEERLLSALPQESRNLIGQMTKLAPACRISIDDCFMDPWFSSVEMCTLDSNGVLCGSEGHVHTQVDQSVAHIAMLEKNKKKNGRK
ncbi:unnamed protein product [Ambrosiozyma monospora]|uniref:non-specific serine/threonine protein kinase n=1 Tax=Ambrosiozyma monospora TaxID=43982 RepID=A0A9W6YS35_AMBMO|nr:unnamed protein product [Ambrosiozyma monospora]